MPILRVFKKEFVGKLIAGKRDSGVTILFSPPEWIKVYGAFQGTNTVPVLYIRLY